MRQTKTDRRSLRTRRLLMEAMVDLIRIKRYDAITVQEITDHANVGRSTFYAHFTGKDDLLVDGVHRMIESLDTPDADMADSTGRGLRPYPSLALLRHIGTQADLYRALSRGRGGLTLFLGALHEELTAKFTERLAASLPPGCTPAVPLPLLAAMTSSMLITAIRTWLEGGLAESAESIDRAFHIAADAAIRAGLGVRGHPGPIHAAVGLG